VSRNIGVKFSTNGTRIDPAAAKRLASIDYLDIQISIDGVDAMTSDRIRGAGSYDAARRAMDNLRAADFGQFKISVVMTRDSVEQLDEFEKLAQLFVRRVEELTSGKNCTRHSRRIVGCTGGCSTDPTC
jgi:MoaA/NifB/PqqE/SkfB family radical SAM enzyme